MSIILKAEIPITKDYENSMEVNSSTITQLSNQITLKVSKNEVISSINQTAESITINANKINFNGFATFNASGLLTSISGNVINTGTLDASKVTVSNLSANSITSGTLDASKITVTNLNASAITSGTFSANRISGGTITGITISGSSITGSTFSTSGSSSTTTLSNGLMEIDGVNNNYALYSDAYVRFFSGGSRVISLEYIDGSITCSKLYVGGYQPITTNTISLQSVSYANTAGYANSANSASSAGSASDLGGTVYISGASNFRPYSDGSIACGTTSGRWSMIYALTGTVYTSDRNQKNTIKDADERYLRFIDKVKPQTYKMNINTSNRTHVGFIAQDVEEAMKECNISDKEFAGFIKSPKYDKITDGEYDPTGNLIGYDYGLRYDEFIPLLLLKIQDLQKQVDDLKVKGEVK